MWADEAFHKLINEYTFDTVLDVGCGEGEHTRRFQAAGKQVTGVDYGKSIYFQKNPDKHDVIISDFNFGHFKQRDCVWASHVLEHQLNVGVFLENIYNSCKIDGIVAVTVPPAHPQILGGHVTIWNAGLLLYNMVLAGFNCKKARIKQYGFNISVIVLKQPAALPELEFDNGDVDRISCFLPDGLKENFDGNIQELNWN